MAIRALLRTGFTGIPALAAIFCSLISTGLLAAADPAKVLRTTIEAQDAGFDPAITANYYSGKIMETVGESLLTYDYVARPSKLIPLAAEAMPLVEDDGRTYTWSGATVNAASLAAPCAYADSMRCSHSFSA